MALLGLVIGWILTIFVGLLGAVVLWKILNDTIDLKYLISDELGWASLSRFQFLIFTFVIAMSLFFVILNHQPYPDYPKIPPEILALLGISGGSYVLSKGIQSSRDVSWIEASGHEPAEAPEKGSKPPEEGSKPAPPPPPPPSTH
jgi:hypothetical protein